MASPRKRPGITVRSPVSITGLSTKESSGPQPWERVLARVGDHAYAVTVGVLAVVLSLAHASWLGALVVAGAIAAWFWAPQVRPWLQARTLRRRVGRAWSNMAFHVLPADKDGTLPECRLVERWDHGLRLLIDLPHGVVPDSIGRNADAIVHGLTNEHLGVNWVKAAVEPGPISGTCYVRLYDGDPLADRSLAWPWRGMPRTTLWDPVPLGVDESGRPITVNLPEHNLLLGGEPGAGKSAVLSLLIAAAALDPSITISLFDAKQVELSLWSKCAEVFVGPEGERAVEVLTDLRAEMDRRYEQLRAEGRRKIVPEDGFGLHVVAIDELAFYLRGGSKPEREGFAEGLRDLVSRGRAAGIVVLAATQKPSHDVVPTYVRDLFSFRLALRCTTPEASDTVLGQGCAAQGYSAATIDPAARGVGFLLAEGGHPVKFRASYLDDGAIRTLARRAAALRAPRSGG